MAAVSNFLIVATFCAVGSHPLDQVLKEERGYLRQFNLHKTNAANEELVINLICGREIQERS